MRAPVDQSRGYQSRCLPVLSLSLLLLLQACGGDSTTFNTHQTQGSGAIGVSATQFSGTILFVKSGNLFLLRGSDDSLTQLTHDGTAAQPAVSPDGKTIAFEVRKPGNDYSDLATLPISGGSVTMLTDDSLHNKSTGAPFHYLFWAANPIWTADGQHIIYLSDFFKGGATTTFPNPTCASLSAKDWILDMGIVELPASARPVAGGQLNDPPRQLAWPYCYAGGDQDLSLRPGVSDTEVLFTSFQYVGANNDLVALLSLLILPADGSASSLIQLSPQDPTLVSLEPSFSPDGKYITYIRRATGQDNLYIMPVDATITGTPDQQSYPLVGNGESVYYTNTTYYKASQKLASGIIGQPVWGNNQTIFFTEYANGEFNLFMAKVKFSGSGQPITLDGSPIQLTQGGIDGTSRPDWFQ
jgi:hypothetical protein